MLQCEVSVAMVTITPGVLATLQNTHQSWVSEDNICPLSTRVVNRTPFAAQLMVVSDDTSYFQLQTLLVGIGGQHYTLWLQVFSLFLI